MSKNPEITVEKAKKDKLFYFVAGVIVYREDDSRCLILKRHEREVVHPGKYAFPGGKLEHGEIAEEGLTSMDIDIPYTPDVVENLLKREAHEEAGIEIGDFKYLSSMVFVRPDGVPVVFLKFAAKYKGGDIVLEEHSFTDHTWVTAEETKNYPVLDSVAGDIELAVASYNS